MSIADQITRLQGAKADLKASIEAKGVTVPSEALIDEYPALVDAIPQGGGGGGVPEKDVNFYDYDGTCVYSYTKSEFLTLSALPANPDHSDEGLVSDGWSGTLEEAKSLVSKCGFCDLGQYYHPSDGKTKYYLHFDSATEFPFLVYLNGNKPSITINWGDGNTETVTAVSSTVTHNYDRGDYVLTITVNRGYFRAVYSSTRAFPNNSYCLKFIRNLKKLVIGNNYLIESYAFAFFDCPIIFPKYPTVLSSITYPLNGYSYPYILWGIPKDTSGNVIFNHLCNGCYAKTIVLPLSLSAAPAGNPSNVFSNTIFVDRLVVPEGVSSFQTATFSSSRCQKLVLPSSITNLGTNAFSYVNHVYELYCFAIVPPTVPTLTTLSQIAELKVYVPADSVDAYKGATNWSALSSKIFAIPE